MENEAKEEKLFLNKNLKQWLIIGSILFFIALLSILFTLFNFGSSEATFIGYRISINVVLKSIFIGVISPLILFLVLFFIPFTEPINFKTKNLIWALILFLCGIAAEVVLNLIFVFYLNFTPYVVFPIVSLVVLVYSYLCYELCFLDHFEDPSKFFEIYRFALVGAIAAIFDFAVTSLMRFVVLKSLPEIWISILAVTCGFIIGVIINYICSVTMVFKKTTEKDISKTGKGIVLFVVLGAVGLGIGMGLEVLFFDVIKLPEPVCFVIRTLVVLVWNYISRKIFIFK